MADIDSLEIEVSAASTDAAQKVNALADALERLKGVLQGNGFESISKHIQGIGEGAANSQLAKRQQAMRRVGERVKGGTQSPEVSTRGLASMERQLKSLGAEFDAALDKAEQLREQLDISRQLRPISDSERAQYTSATQEVERLSNSYHKLEERIKAINSVNAGKTVPVDTSSSKALDSVTSKVDTLNKVSEKISQTKLEGPTIDVGVTEEIQSVTEQVEELQNVSDQVDRTRINVDVGQSASFDQGAITKGINQIFSGTKLGEKVGNFTNLVQEINNVSSAASTASGATAELGASAAGAGAAGAGAMAGLAGAAGLVVAALELVKQKFNENKEFLQSDRSLWTDTSWDKMGEGIQNVAAFLMIFNPAMKGAVYAARSFIQPGQELLSILGELAGNGFQKAGNALRNFATSGFEKAGNAMKSLAGNIGNGIKSISSNMAQRFVKPFTSAIGAVQKWKSSIGRLAFYRAINAAVRTVTDGLKTGMDNLYQFSQMADGRFASSMDSLASSALYLKNSLGSMAAPLINAVAPAIDFIISKLVTLINLIGTVFAVLSGAGSFTQAKKQATSYGDALGGAAGAAKELQDYVLGIDELNIIKDTSGGGGGGGGGGMGFEDMFEEVPLPDWAQQMQDAINKGDWYGAGTILADHLNKIVEDWDAKAWGTKLGEKINNGLDFALGFLREFNFDELGGKLADAINGIGEGINFDTLGRVIGAGWNSVFDTANGFFKRLDWKMWGRKIADAINGFVDEVHWDVIGETFSNGAKGLLTMFDEAIRRTQWFKLGASLAEMLNHVEWGNIIELAFKTVQDAIKAAAKTLEGFCANFHWNEVANEIAAGINRGLSHMSEQEWQAVGQAIGNTFTKGFNFVRTIIERIDWPQLGRDIAAFLKGVPWGSLLESAGGAIAAGFNAVIDTVYEIVADSAFWAKLGSGVFTGVQTFFNDLEIDKAIDGLSMAIVRGIKLALSAINGLVTADSFWQKLGTGIKTGISNFFNNVSPTEIATAVSGLLQRAIDTAIVGISELASHGDWWIELGTAIGNGINNLIANTNWEELLTSLAKLATDILNGLSAALRKINWGNAWNTIKEALDKVQWGPLVDAAMGFFAEAFKAKMQLKLFQGKLFLDIGSKIGGELINGILEGLKDIPILGFFITLGETLLRYVGNITETIGKVIQALWTGNWKDISKIISDGWENAKQITLEAGEDLIDNTTKISQSILSDVEEKTGGVASAVSGTGRQVTSDWQDTLEQVLRDTEEKTANVKNTASGKFMELQGDLFLTMGTIAEDVNNAWGQTEKTTDEKWRSIGTFLNSTWNGLQTAADVGFTAMYGSARDNWDSSEEKTNSSWSAQDSLLKTIWNGLESASETSFGNMYSTVDSNWTAAGNSTTTNWADIATTTNTKAGEALTAVKTNFNQVSGAVTSGLQAAVTAGKQVDFKSIGTHIASGISAGFQEKVEALKRNMVDGINAMKEAAQRAAKINSPSRLFRDEIGVFLGLGVAEGIDKSVPSIVSTIYNANDQMKDAFTTSAFTNPEDLQFPVHEDFSASYKVEHSYDSQQEEDTATRFAESMRVANTDVIDVLYTLFGQAIEAINGVADRPIELDGKPIMKSVEKQQRQRGANILAGGVM